MDIVSRPAAASQRMRYHFARLQTAPQLTAVIDCLFEIAPARTKYVFDGLVIVDDCLVFARVAGDTTFKHYVGRRDELIVNLVGFVTHLGFGTLEHEYVLSRIEGIPRRRAAVV